MKHESINNNDDDDELIPLNNLHINFIIIPIIISMNVLSFVVQQLILLLYRGDYIVYILLQGTSFIVLSCQYGIEIFIHMICSCVNHPLYSIEIELFSSSI